MTRTGWMVVAGAILVLDAAAAGAAPPGQSSVGKALVATTSGNKDEEAVRKLASDFCQAFDKKDAQAIAALFAENGEYQDDAGQHLRGREAIEKTYSDFFKENHGRKVDIRVQSVRFPTPDVAIEEGIIHETSSGKDLPTTTRYTAIDARVDGGWKTAMCTETGNGQDHLDDLNWLVGKWRGSGKVQEMNLSFEWDAKQPILLAKISRTVKGKPAESGTIKVGFDPRRGVLHSWHSDDDGGHGHSQWHRDGSKWVISATGLTNDGKETAAENVLTRIDNNNFTWRSINRMMGDQQLPDTAPLKLTRVSDGK